MSHCLQLKRPRNSTVPAQSQHIITTTSHINTTTAHTHKARVLTVSCKYASKQSMPGQLDPGVCATLLIDELLLLSPYHSSSHPVPDKLENIIDFTYTFCWNIQNFQTQATKIEGRGTSSKPSVFIFNFYFQIAKIEDVKGYIQFPEPSWPLCPVPGGSLLGCPW